MQKQLSILGSMDDEKMVLTSKGDEQKLELVREESVVISQQGSEETDVPLCLKDINTAVSFFLQGDYESADFYLFHARKKLYESYDYDRVIKPEFIEGRREQPELPKLKNKEERRAWLKAYRDWGLWYEDGVLEARYYKYDFSDNSRIIVVEYKESEEIAKRLKREWTSPCYHLVGAGKKFQCLSDSESVLLDFLMRLQKGEKVKGV